MRAMDWYPSLRQRPRYCCGLQAAGRSSSALLVQKLPCGVKNGSRGVGAAGDDFATTAFEGGAGAVRDDFAEAIVGGEAVFTDEKLFGKSQGVGVGKIIAAAQANGDGLALAMLTEEIDCGADEAVEGVAGVDQAEEFDGEFALLLTALPLRRWTSLNWRRMCVSRCSRNLAAV